MDFNKVPLGFGMALSTNFQAMNAWSAMTEGEQQTVLSKAYQARSEKEMHKIIHDIVENRMR